MGTSVLIFFFGYALGFAGHIIYVKLDRNSSTKEATPSASHNSASIKLVCPDCGSEAYKTLHCFNRNCDNYEYA